MKHSNFYLVIAFILININIFAENPPVFYESFSKMNWEYIVANGTKEILAGGYDDICDNPGWTGNKMYYGYKRTTDTELFTEFNEVAFPRFGTSKTDSYLITPTLDLTGGVIVRFKVKSFIRNTDGEPTIENPNMKVEYAPDGSSFATFFEVSDMDGIFAEKSFDIPAAQATANAKLKFNRQTSVANNRFFISDIVIEKKVYTSVNKLQSSDYNIYATNEGIILNADKTVIAEIFSLTGMKIQEVLTVQGSNFIPLAQGLHIVRVEGNSTKIIVE